MLNNSINTQTVYLADQSSAFAFTTSAGGKGSVIVGFGNNNTVEFTTTINSWQYTSSGTLAVWGGLLNFYSANVNIGHGCNQSLFHLTKADYGYEMSAHSRATSYNGPIEAPTRYLTCQNFKKNLSSMKNPWKHSRLLKYLKEAQQRPSLLGSPLLYSLFKTENPLLILGFNRMVLLC